MAEPEPAQEAPAAKPEPKPEPHQPPAPTNSADQADPILLPGNGMFLNVMELLVDEGLERYGKAANMCQCPRCLADAKALALSRLPSKYVVLPLPAMPPMMSLYRDEFRSDILSQVIFACNTVAQNPRHPAGGEM